MAKQTYYVKGMHCASCELLIEGKALEIEGVDFADASMANNTLVIDYKNKKPSSETLNRALKESGYKFSETPFEPKKGDIEFDEQPILIALLAIGIFLLLSKLGLTSFINIGQGSSLAAFFAFGIIAGLSTCAALVGGLVLSLAKQWNDSYGQNDSVVEKSKPHLLFNFGRLVSYAIVGGLLGALGAKFRISVTITSIMVIAVSIVMFVLAMQMLGVRWFNKFRVALPKSLSGQITDKKQRNGKFAPFIVGFFTFLLPCGFTLAAEGLAVLSGNPLKGSLIMLAFALGTTLPLLAIGLSSAKLIASPKTSQKFLKAAGILIIFFVAYNLNFQFGITRYLGSFQANGQNNITDNSGNEQNNGNSGQSNQNQDAQVIKTVYRNGADISPSQFTVKAGKPVRFEVDVQDDGYGCMGTIMVPGLWDKPLSLKKGKLLVMEFTPQKPGNYQITCAMGVPRGTIEVTE